MKNTFEKTEILKRYVECLEWRLNNPPLPIHTPTPNFENENTISEIETKLKIIKANRKIKKLNSKNK